MKRIKLRVVSESGVEATITSEGQQGGKEDYYAIVSVHGILEDKKIYGIDPVQSFTLGLKLIEQLTQEKRIGGEDEVAPGASWKIEAILD